MTDRQYREYVRAYVDALGGTYKSRDSAERRSLYKQAAAIAQELAEGCADGERERQVWMDLACLHLDSARRENERS